MPAYVSGRFTQKYGADFANALGIANEIGGRISNSPSQRNMDFWNNSVGRKYGSETSSPEELANSLKHALDSNELIEDLDDPRKFSNSDNLLNDLKDLSQALGSELNNLLSEFIKDHFAGIISFNNSHLSPIIQSLLQNMSAAESQILIRRSDPLVLDLNNNGEVDLVAISESKVFFDLDNDGFKEQVGWVSGVDGILALDSNGNGVVDNIDELFGERLASGSVVTGTEERRRDWDSK